MTNWPLIAAVLSGIGLLLALILYFKMPAFISLLLASITVGLVAGMDAAEILKSIQQGMGDTLGFVATVVGLGAMFGAILEHSGGARAIAAYLINRMGVRRAPTAMMLSGFIIAIPVFFDVAFIILVPVIYALQRKTNLSLLHYAIPLLAGLAISHTFIPPTPGPVAVAETLGVELGWVMLAGLVVGLPTALVSGLWFGRYISRRIFVEAPAEEASDAPESLPSAGLIISIIAIPIVLIILGTTLKSNLLPFEISASVRNALELISHPFCALIIANLVAWYVLGIRRGWTKAALLDISTRSMAPAGTIILLTGAGGVLKQMLIATGIGTLLAESLTAIGFPALLFAFIAAALVRVLQGSATVAMITAASLVAPLIDKTQTSAIDIAFLVTAIAAGASILSHVNDSGFWLISRYLNLSERQAFRSWSVMTTILALTGFTMTCLLAWVF